MSRGLGDVYKRQILDIGDTIMDEETETIIFHSQEWDEVDSDVDL